MNIKLLTEHHFGFLSLKGGCAGLSEFIRVKMPHCWKSHVVAQMLYFVIYGCVKSCILDGCIEKQCPDDGFLGKGCKCWCRDPDNKIPVVPCTKEGN